MRLTRLILLLIVAQLVVAGLSGGYTYLEYLKERDKMILGDFLTLRFMTMGKQYDNSFRQALYDVGPGMVESIREGEAASMKVPPNFAKTNMRMVEVLLVDHIGRDTSPELLELLQSEQNIALREYGDEIWVSTKIYRRGEKEPYGIIRITNNPRGLANQVIMRSMFLYLLIFVLVNGQFISVYVLISRRREVVFQKGYLKEHALGALKIHHKILGDIISDHEDEASAGESENDGQLVEFPGKNR